MPNKRGDQDKSDRRYIICLTFVYMMACQSLLLNMSGKARRQLSNGRCITAEGCRPCGPGVPSPPEACRVSDRRRRVIFRRPKSRPTAITSSMQNERGDQDEANGRFIICLTVVYMMACRSLLLQMSGEARLHRQLSNRGHSAQIARLARN